MDYVRSVVSVEENKLRGNCEVIDVRKIIQEKKREI